MRPFAVESRIFARASSALLGEAVTEAEAAEFLGDMGRRAPAPVAWGVRAVVWLAYVAPVPLIGGTRTVLTLPDEKIAEAWVVALDHPSYVVRQLALLLKAFACLVRYDDVRRA